MDKTLLYYAKCKVELIESELDKLRNKAETSDTLALEAGKEKHIDELNKLILDYENGCFENEVPNMNTFKLIQEAASWINRNK